MTIELRGINKSFGDTRALDNVSLKLEEGKIYGLLGNNGAGKSTMLNIITSRYFADDGDLLLNGEPMRDSDELLGQIYMMSEKNYYPEAMKVKEAIKWGSRFYPHFDKQKADALSKQFNLPVKKKITDLSTGYTSIFKIIMALSSGAPILLFDEPVLGLDAQHRDIFYKLVIEHYSENPCTIVISTHLIAEAENLIEHCLIIKKGRLIRDIPCEKLQEEGYTISGSAKIVDEYLSGKSVLSSTNLGGLKTACLSGSMPEQSGLPMGLEVSKLGLQEYFIQLMNDESGEN